MISSSFFSASLVHPIAGVSLGVESESLSPMSPRTTWKAWDFGVARFSLAACLVRPQYVLRAGQLREKKKGRMDDRANVCFICGISRAELDRHGDGFDAHIRAEHHTWVV